MRGAGVEKAVASVGSSVAMLALLETAQIVRPPCHCFFYPTTHTEPPAGFLADAQVAAIPTLNFSQRRRFGALTLF